MNCKTSFPLFSPVRRGFLCAKMISSVVLAAGRADRASEQKLLLPLRDKPVLQWVLESALASDLHEIICVVRDLEAVRRRITLSDERLYWLTNPAADQGQSSFGHRRPLGHRSKK